MTIKLYKSKETCFPNINTKGTHFFISVFDTLKEKKMPTYFRQYTRNNK